jgi:hypothetical protein
VVFFVTTLCAIATDLYALGRIGLALWLLMRAFATSMGIVAALWLVMLALRLGFLAAEVIGLRLFLNEDKRTPAFWSRYFAATAGLIPLYIGVAHLAALQIYHGSPPSPPGLSSRTAAILACGVSLAWCSYWSRSRRVRNTYGYTGWRLSRPSESLPTAPAA